MVNHQDKPTYKEIRLQSNAHREYYSQSGKFKPNNDLIYALHFANNYKRKGDVMGIVDFIMSMRKTYYDSKLPVGFGSVANLVKASKNK